MTARFMVDHEDFLRQRRLEPLRPEHPALVRFKARRCATLEEVRAWVAEERKRGRTNTDKHGRARTNAPMATSVKVGESPCASVSSAQLVANAALSLLNLACHLLDRQLGAQAAAFEKEGEFTERLHRLRSARRQGLSGP
jgi:four helix bundle suffix protein